MAQLGRAHACELAILLTYQANMLKKVDYFNMGMESAPYYLDPTQDTAAARDAVKKEALRKAGIGYHEVVAGHTTAGELRRLAERLVPGGGREMRL